ncbi:transposase family protein [Micromonospora sp. 4G57]|uniref:Transposase family protein n=1 Tax=Micromonospora sicca TaxID=2202420 RepID=A0ABU5JN28_9ACTN|nr:MULTISPECIES: transposase family protein [unclassified Micromonospora]MDZ5447211.1 transposase family protein [Micromonospora sp. 4G57]MDZ5493922.1 transposase family protein [Micromonospora sp. 4G53]
MEFFRLPGHLRGPHPRCQHARSPYCPQSPPPTDTPPRLVTECEQEGLLHALSAVPDPRSPRGLRYPLAGLLAVAVCAVMAGASSVTAIADWLHDLDEAARARLGFGRGVPATTTMWRLLIRLDADLLSTILAGWLQARTRPAVSRRRRGTGR